MIQRWWFGLGFALAAGCTCGRLPLIPGWDASFQDASMDASMDAQVTPDGGPQDGGPPPDRGPLDPDAACSSETATATVERLPVDILWVIDNSGSMRPAIEQVQAGLNDFAALVGARDLDYRVIMLSLRGRGSTSVGGSTRYQVCIPPPLAGDTDCGDGSSFFQVSVDIRSTQPLEQFLGTLGQTAGYREGESRGSAPWEDLLRPEATKTIVVVTDDNARMVVRGASGGFVAGPTGGGDPVATADWFETTEAASNPFNGNMLPEGILHPRWSGLFDGYTFSGLYGWASEVDPLLICRYPDGSSPPTSGRTYTELVSRTSGARAQICSGASAWGPFFDDIASAVERASRIDCTIAIPPPPPGQFFERTRINVLVDVGDGPERLGKVDDAAACDERGGWHYDDEAAPTSVILCPSTCESLQAAPGESRQVDVQFGCQTIPI